MTFLRNVFKKKFLIACQDTTENIERKQGRMDVVISRARESLPLHDDIRWTCPIDSKRECTIRAFQEDDKTYVNIFENDVDGLYDLNVRSINIKFFFFHIWDVKKIYYCGCTENEKVGRMEAWGENLTTTEGFTTREKWAKISIFYCFKMIFAFIRILCLLS